jgi:subtilisin family serine protease
MTRRLAPLFAAAAVCGLALTSLATAPAGAAAPAAGAVAAVPGPSDAPEYWFDTWHAEQLWSSGADGTGITIAEIDTGVNASLPALNGRVLSGTDFGISGNGQIDRDSDKFGHGTAMASIMVGRPSSFGVTGLAPGAKILPIAVPLIGTTDQQSNDHLDSAIQYAADHGAKIISMSLGGTRTQKRDGQACYPAEQTAIFHALEKGILVLASSGNRGDKDNAVEEPGVCLGVVSVGAVDSSGAVAAFSSRHPYLTLTAPGVGIATLGRIEGQAYSGEGTSQATALASAAAALVWSKYPKLTAEQLLTRLLATTDHHSTTQNPAYGYGIINPYSAINAAQPAATTNPVYAAAKPFIDGVVTPPTADRPTPVANAGAPQGVFEVGSRPGRITAAVIAGLAVAAAGLVLLVALTVVGAGRSRRRSRDRAAARAAAARHQVPVPFVDADGIAWHQVSGPAAQYPVDRADDGPQ